MILIQTDRCIAAIKEMGRHKQAKLTAVQAHVSQNHECFIENEETFIGNEEFCIKTRDFVSKMMNFVLKMMNFGRALQSSSPWRDRS